MDVAEQARPVKGFRFAGISAGLKAVFGKPDLGLRPVFSPPIRSRRLR